MQKMHAWMKSIGNKITGKHIDTASTLLVFSYTYAAITKTQTIPTFKTAFEYLKTMKKPTFKCFTQTDVNLVHASSSTDRGHRYDAEIQVDEEGSNEEAEEEFRIILLGATGSGKSLTGNWLLGGERFKTSCFAKAETKKSKLQSTLKPLIFESIEKKIKINIIDTPAVRDSGLTDQDVEHEIEEALELAKPGPHAFLLCIPATSITNYYIDVIKRYEKYVDNDITDFIIVAFTRYEQFMPEFCDETQKKEKFNEKIKTAIRENDILKNMNILNKYILLNKNDGDKNKKLTDVITIINANRIKRLHSRKEEYAVPKRKEAPKQE